MEKRKIPAVRFKGFEDDWEQRKLGELSSSFEYGLNAAAKEYDGENKYIRITDIDDDSRKFKQADITSPDTDLSSAENYKLSEGDILFARTGASVGKTYIYKASDGLVYYAGFLIRAKIKPEYNSKFVFQNTLTGNYEKFIKVTSMRSGQPGVNAQEYSQYQIMMPSKLEQDKISDCLRNLDNFITLHQRKLEKLQLVKKSMLEKMFPKNGSKIPEIRFEGFADDWEQRKLGEVIRLNGRIGFRGYTEKDIVSKDDGGVLTFSPTNIVDNKLTTNCKNTYITRFKYDESPEIKIHNGDILFVKTGSTLGKSALVTGLSEDATLNPQVVVMRTNNLNAEFLAAMLVTNTIIMQVNSAKIGGAVPTLTETRIKDFDVSIPVSEAEKEQIGKFFSQLDHLITLHQRKLEKLKSFKKSLLEKLFVQ